MIIKFSLVRLSIIFILVLLFPLVQKQWLNLYLYDINNLNFYKILYYLSGLVVPIFVIINSLSKFTYYKFDYHKLNFSNNIKGKLLLLITSIVSVILSLLISNYIFINIKIFLDLFSINDNYFAQFDINKQILFSVLILILLLFKKTKLLLKKIILINFFIISVIIWYYQINNILLNNLGPIDIIKFSNVNFINITFMLIIETVFYLWSYISSGSYLSDWSVPKPYIREISPILIILMFYLFIILYYSILTN